MAGGAPWPPASATTAGPEAEAGAAADAVAEDGAGSGTETETAAGQPPQSATVPADAAVGVAAATGRPMPIRRGLPRAAGGAPWPEIDEVRPSGAAKGRAVVPADAAAAASVAASSASASTAPPQSPVPSARDDAAVDVVRPALPFRPTAWRGSGAGVPARDRSAPRRFGPFTRLQWAGAVVVVGLILLIAAGMGVALVRWLLSLDGMRDFVAAYPGEYHLPDGAPVGLPAWIGWQHFFNAFLMVLIIRSGLQVRREKRPVVFWAPRGKPKRKTSLTIWFHQALDVLWLVNGLVFVVLLFATGQWMRIVPTSWEVFPNALSAALQYVSLDWPTENGWVGYNSLQQLAYFSTVFVAAPLATLSGVRMSWLWPRGDRPLNRLYPIEWARRIHFPVMLYFVVFIVIHVALVLATGALRNLNHMYAAQGSVDPDAYAANWTGFWMFVLSLGVIAAAWVAARPVVLTPIARLFGTVSGR